MAAKNFPQQNKYGLLSLTEVLNRLETLWAIAHSNEWLASAFTREAQRLGVTPDHVWALWTTYQVWGGGSRG